MKTADLYRLTVDIDHVEGITTRYLHQDFGEGMLLLIAMRTVENYWDPAIPRDVLATDVPSLDEVSLK